MFLQLSGNAIPFFILIYTHAFDKEGVIQGIEYDETSQASTGERERED